MALETALAAPVASAAAASRTAAEAVAVAYNSLSVARAATLQGLRALAAQAVAREEASVTEADSEVAATLAEARQEGATRSAIRRAIKLWTWLGNFSQMRHVDPRHGSSQSFFLVLNLHSNSSLFLPTSLLRNTR